MNLLIKWKILLLFSMLCLIWGSSFLLIKIGLEAYNPLQVAVIRLCSTLPIVTPFAFKLLGRIPKSSLGIVVLVGLISTLIPSFLFALAQVHVNSATAGILNATVPIFTLVVGYFFFKQRVNRTQILAIIIGLFAVGIVVVQGNGTDFSLNYFTLFILLATLGYSFNINTIKTKLEDIDAFAIAMVSVFFSGLLALPLLIFDWSEFVKATESGSITPLGSLLILGILGTVIAQYLQNAIIKSTDIAFASSVTYVIPIVAVFWGVLDGENINVSTIIAGFGILLCVYLTRLK
ncbi:DMT family transporter [Jiulongibacter sp. NS-SX5]|uniref:DMT family transporter n=1 Tax=Jiulongibacter sp. NS-SX5 TaxID=3463854 RepID=UPI004059248F